MVLVVEIIIMIIYNSPVVEEEKFMKHATHVAFDDAVESIMNVEKLGENTRVSIVKAAGSSPASRASYKVIVNHQEVSSFARENGEVRLDELLKVKQEITGFVMCQGKMVKHLNRYFSIWDTPKPLPEILLKAHYVTQANRLYSPHYQARDAISFYNKSSVTVERTFSDEESLLFTLHAPDMVLSYLECAIKDDNLSRAVRDEIEDNFSLIHEGGA
jgi:hypothetical protein